MTIQASYFYIYLIFSFILVGFKLYPSAGRECISPDNAKDAFRKSMVLGIFLIIFFAFRPMGYLDSMGRIAPIGDTPVYVNAYDKVANEVLPPDADYMNSNGNIKLGAYLFYYIRNLMALAGIDVRWWLLIVAIIYVLPVVLTFSLLTPRHSYLGMMFWLVSLGCYGFGVNGIKSGDASSVFLYGLALILYSMKSWKNQRLSLIGMAVCCSSFLFHSSMLMAICALFAAMFIIKGTNQAIILWCATIIIALVFGNALGLIANEQFADDRLNTYISKTSYSASLISRFRWDFVLYSALPIWFGWYVTVRRGIKDSIYQLVLNTYILTNSIFILFIYSAFPNRFAAVSWIISPIVLFYPMVKYRLFPGKQNSYVGYMLLGQLVIFFLIN